MQVWKILVRYAGWRLALSVVAGAAAGASLAAMMRLIHRTLTLPSPASGRTAGEFLALLAVYFFGNVIAQHTMSDAAERLQWHLRLKLVRQVLASPLRQLERLGPAQLFNVLGHDVKVLADYVCGLPDGLVNVTITIGCFGYMAWLSPLVFFFNLVFVALAAACYLVPEKISQRIGHRAAAAHDRLIAQLDYAVRAAKGLLLSRPRRADFLDTHFAVSGHAVRRLNRQSRLIHLLAERFAEVMVLGNVACLLFVLPRLIDLPAATATGILLAAIFARQPLKDSLDNMPRTQRARVAIERMQRAGHEPSAPDAAEPIAENPAATAPFRELALQQVGFHYENDHGQPGFSTGPFSLQVRAGEIVFIVGGNGAGKTTLAKLLCGLYPPAIGTITLDGQPVTDEAGRAAQRARFSAVFPDDPLFTHLLGIAPAETSARGAALLTELKLADKVGLRGTEFSTVDLSQGQRRRLLLLGALIEDRPVLQLDDAPADQEREFRNFFYDHIGPAGRARGRTLVLITHDDRYFDRADRIVKLDLGQIVEANPATAGRKT